MVLSSTPTLCSDGAGRSSLSPVIMTIFLMPSFLSSFITSGAWTERILDADHSRQSSRDREIQGGSTLPEGLQISLVRPPGLRTARPQIQSGSFLITTLSLADMGGNSVSNDIVDLGVHLLVGQVRALWT